MVMQRSCGSIQGHHLVAPAGEQTGNERSDEGAVGVEIKGNGSRGNIIEKLGEIRPEHGFPAGDAPPLATHFPGFINEADYFLTRELRGFLFGVGWNSQPTVAAIIIAAVGEVEAARQGETRQKGGILLLSIADLSHLWVVSCSQTLREMLA